MTALRTQPIFPNKAFVYAYMVPSWADQLLLQHLMEQFDTLLIQCRNIETLNKCMKEFGSEKKNDKMTAVRTKTIFP